MKKTKAQLTEEAKTARLRALRLERDKARAKDNLDVENTYPDRIFDFRDKMPFGKHKGETIEQIMSDDIRYITWLLENVKNFSLSDEAMDVYNILID